MIEQNAEVRQSIESVQNLPATRNHVVSHIDDTGSVSARPEVAHQNLDSEQQPYIKNRAATSKNRVVDTGDDDIQRYLIDIGKVPLLTAAEEVELSKKVQAALATIKAIADEKRDPTDSEEHVLALGRDAKTAFINANLRLVVSIAKRYPLPTAWSLLDLIQEGNLGLEHAVDKFDWKKGFKFSTYATFWIRQGIGRAIDTKGSIIHVPSEKHIELRRAIRSKGDTYDPSQLTASQLQVHNIINPTSLDRPLTPEGDDTISDTIASKATSPEDQAIASLMSSTILESIYKLPDRREATAVILRFGLTSGHPATLGEVGEELGCSSEYARQLVNRAIKRLREYINESDLLVDNRGDM